MDSKYKDMIFESYIACMNDKETDEQRLIWSLSNAICCIKTRLAMNDVEYVHKILSDYDYTTK